LRSATVDAARASRLWARFGTPSSSSLVVNHETGGSRRKLPAPSSTNAPVPLDVPRSAVSSSDPMLPSLAV